MGYFFVITTLFLSLTLTKTLADVSSLQDQGQGHLDPLQDQDQDLSTNNQDKRTICSALNKCGGSAAPTSGYYKRLVIRGGLKHQLIGYRPVGVRPVVLGGYRYTKPKIQFRLRVPSAIRGGWNPVPTATKPVVELRPSNHVDVVHNNPVPHVDHVASSPVHVDHVHVQPDHVHVQPDHVHLQPTQPTFVHLRPVATPAAHVDQVHQINVAHGNHYDTFTHLDHIQPVVQPVLPVAPPPAVVRPVAPAPILFEVTKPNLGVLPLGARFPSPVLRQVPHLHLNPVAPIAPALPVAPVGHGHAVQGIIHTPVGLPAIAPQPGVSVEYHGTRNYLPLPGAVLAQPFPQPGLNPHQHVPHAFTPQQALPFEHAAHGFAIPQQALPHEHPTQFRAVAQQLPHEHATQFLAAQQQLPHEHQTYAPEHQNNPYFQQQLQSIQQYQDIPQGQLPLEGEQQQNFDHFLQSNQEALNLQHFDESNVIQPGQTDLQIPYHLPQHGGWEGVQQVGLQEESRGSGEQQVFRPSQQLEAPYTK